MTNYFKVLTCAIALYLLSGCVHVTKPMTTQDKLIPEMGYIYGKFNLSADSPDMDIVLILVDASAEKAKRKNPFKKVTVKRYGVRFDKVNDIYSIAVKPGTYRLKGFEYGTGGNLQKKNNSLSDADGLMSKEFTVEAGKAYYLGDWYGSGSITSSYPMTYYSWKLNKIAFTYSETSNQFFSLYKNLSQLPHTTAFELDYSPELKRDNPQTYKIEDLKKAISYAEYDLALSMASHLQNEEPDALAYLGYFHEKGIGVEVDYKKAVEFYQKSVEKESAIGMWTLGSFYYNTSKYLTSDAEKQKTYRDYAYKLMQASALYGYPKAIALQCEVFTADEVGGNVRILGEAWCNVGKKMLSDENHDVFEDTPVVKGYKENLVRADQAKVAELQAEMEKAMIENNVVFLR